MPNTIKIPKSFEKELTKFLTKDLGKIDVAGELLKKGYWVTYEDNKGRLIREYPNGKKYLVKFNETNYTMCQEELK